jgi:arginine exporter protein ArgO
MLEALIQIVGPIFLVAIALEAVSVLAEQWGAARSPDEDAPKHNALALLALLLTILTPGLLLAHGYVATHAQDQSLLVIAVGLPVAAVLVGALLGAILGAAVKGAAPLMRKLALPLDIIAFAVTIYATLATIQVLIQAAQNGGGVAP